MKLTFSTPCGFGDGVFGASFGFAGAMDPAAHLQRTFSRDLEGVLLTGSFHEILASVPAAHYRAGVVLLGNYGGEDAFIRALQEKARCPLTGGSAAIDPATGEKALILSRGEAAVYLITDRRFAVTVESRNIHETILEECRITMESPRVIAAVNDEEPVAWFTEKRRAHGIAERDFEHMTLSDTLGVNAHLSVVDGKLCSGRDLEETMLLRMVEEKDVLPRMQAFYDDPTALVCGCAGLKGILPGPIVSPGTGLFLFGEVCTVHEQSRFGNLMLSKLCVKEG